MFLLVLDILSSVVELTMEQEGHQLPLVPRWEGALGALGVSGRTRAEGVECHELLQLVCRIEWHTHGESGAHTFFRRLRLHLFEHRILLETIGQVRVL